MLIVSCKSGDVLLIGDIEVEIGQFQKEGIELAITAPAEVGVYTKDVYHLMQKSNRAAVRISHKPVPELLKDKLKGRKIS